MKKLPNSISSLSEAIYRMESRSNLFICLFLCPSCVGQIDTSFHFRHIKFQGFCGKLQMLSSHAIEKKLRHRVTTWIYTGDGLRRLKSCIKRRELKMIPERLFLKGHSLMHTQDFV